MAELIEHGQEAHTCPIPSSAFPFFLPSGFEIRGLRSGSEAYDSVDPPFSLVGFCGKSQNTTVGKFANNFSERGLQPSISGQALLFDLLRKNWLVCERLAQTKRLVQTHQEYGWIRHLKYPISHISARALAGRKQVLKEAKLPGPTILEIPDHGGTVPIIVGLHFNSHIWHGGNPFELHGAEDHFGHEEVDGLIFTGDLSGTFGPALRDVLAYLAHCEPAEQNHEASEAPR